MKRGLLLAVAVVMLSFFGSNVMAFGVNSTTGKVKVVNPKKKIKKAFNIGKYLDDINKQLSTYNNGAVTIEKYALVDVDHDGKNELCVYSDIPTYTAVFSIVGTKPYLLAIADGRTSIVFFQHGVGYQGGCGTSCHTSGYSVVRNSREAYSFNIYEQYDMEGRLLETNSKKNGKEIAYEEAMQLLDSGELGEVVEVKLNWQPVK